MPDFEPAAGFEERLVHLVQCRGCGAVVGALDPACVATIAQDVREALDSSVD